MFLIFCNEREAYPFAACVDMDHVIRQKTYMQTIAEQANKAAITLMRDVERREQLAMDVCVDPAPEQTNSLRRSPMEASVSGCPLPRVARSPSTASRSSGSAAARSPLAHSSRPRMLMEASVSGCHLPRVSRRPYSASRYSGLAEARSPLACCSRPRLLME